MTRATIGINLLWLVPGEVGGSEESTLASVRALVELADPSLDLRLFVLESMLNAHPDVTSSLPTEVLPLSGQARWARVAAETSWLAARSRGLDLVHHAGGTAPPLRTTPYVLTLHDIQPLEAQATHSAIKRAYLSAAIPPSVRRARLTAVPSEFVRRAVLTRLKVDPDRVVVVPHGVDVLAAPTPVAVLRERYRLDGPVVLYPAITYPHKNHAVLIDAFAEVVRRHPDALLVLPGGRGGEEDRLRDRIDGLGLRPRVRRTGRISAADVAGLYGEAAVVAVPSRYEGFGLPAAEAMAYGAPLVAAASTALPEVVGDAGRLVDPDDVGGWADAIAGLLDDTGERRRLADAGRRRALRYTWGANAAALAAVYHRAL
ncbi:MAG: glycosyltransferase family 1 protein [Acidimicrobiales bacterium]